MTTNPLDAIQARADAATEGPWRIEKDREEDYEQGIPYSEWPQTLVGPANAFPSGWSKEHGTTHQVDEISELTFPDAEFIAHAREDVPKLIAALRAVEAVHKKEACCGSADCTGTVVCEGCQNYWPCPTITAIREALG